MKYLYVIFIFSIFLLSVSCKSKKAFIPSEEDVNQEARSFAHKGQDLKPKEDEKMERLINKVEEIKKKQIKYQQELAKENLLNSPIYKRKLAKAKKKELKKRKRIQKYHKHLNFKRQSPQMKKKIRARRRKDFFRGK